MKRLILLAMVAAPLAFAHDGEPLKPHDLWMAWSFDPGIVIPLLLTALLYLRGANGGARRLFKTETLFLGRMVSPLRSFVVAVASAWRGAVFGAHGAT